MPFATPNAPPHSANEFGVAIFCALPLEAQSVKCALDERWDGRRYVRAPGDNNEYTLGSIGEHNIVLVHMTSTGTERATSAAMNLNATFRKIKLNLVVGICGGMPKTPNGDEILLGDVIISETLIQYDFGSQYNQGFIRKTDTLNILGPPTESILAFQAKLKTPWYKETMQQNVSNCLSSIQQKLVNTKHPGMENDILYKSSYLHKHHSQMLCNVCANTGDVCNIAIKMECEELGCDSNQHVQRVRQSDLFATQPLIHLGTMGSSNTVLKSSHHRDILAETEKLTAVEMEGAGVWRHGPSIVIKGVCDYADSHKSSKWQPYAAATAAACTKAYLLAWTSQVKNRFFRRRLLNQSTQGHFWRHMTFACLQAYQEVWDDLAEFYGDYIRLEELVMGLKAARIIPTTTDAHNRIEALITIHWVTLLTASTNYSGVSASLSADTVRFPQNLVIAVLYMTHVNCYFPNELPNSLKDPRVKISEKRWRTLVRFNSWVDCACEKTTGRDCGLCWNHVLEVPFCRPKATVDATNSSGEETCLALKTMRPTREQVSPRDWEIGHAIRKSIYDRFYGKHSKQLPI